MVDVKYMIRTCKKHGETKFIWADDIRYTNNGHWICIECRRFRDLRYRHKMGICNPMSENKNCPGYLGIHIAERILSKYFDDITRMSNNNSKYDFICKNGYKIDVKCGCIRHGNKQSDHWDFTIRNNNVTDYFLCLGFNNRTDLEPQHVWLIPGKEVNHLTGLCITNSDKWLRKWNKYEKPLDKVIECCNILKSESKEIN